ncbi:MAG: MaoC family dehydratase [Emcibacter sp.]|nr:MaoC family dehydratase [Emcibacter sp.]
MINISEFRKLSGTEIGISEWIFLTQEKVNQFADVTGDHQFIHVDPVAAKAAGFDSTIVHGYYLLSLVSKFLFDLLPEVEGTSAVLNYGLNKVRFIASVPVGSRVRGQVSMTEITERGAGQFLATFKIILEIEGQDKPAFIAEQLTLFLTS